MLQQFNTEIEQKSSQQTAATSNRSNPTEKRISRSHEEANVFELEEEANDELLEQNNSSAGTGAETNSTTLDRSLSNSSDDDESTDNHETIAIDLRNPSVLKKRNSNVESELRESKQDDTNINLNQTFNSIKSIKMYKQNSYGAFNKAESRAQSKYSCSLPRDIPYMPLKLNLLAQKKTDADEIIRSSDDEDENRNKNVTADITSKPYKEKSKAASIKFKQENEMIGNYGDDELFEDEKGSYKEEPINSGRRIKFDLSGGLDDRRPTTDMGQAISDLASSIVMKDGSELFGERPSRRVHINSISKSFF
jgi:hypothetical protein